MRFLLVGFLALWPAALALGQARGEVESIGFGGEFRPGCWTPMVVKLVPTSGSPFVGRIEVIQEDLDGDLVHFARQINFSGNPSGGQSAEARFWMYFIPQSTRAKGRTLDGTQNRDQLTDIIKVRLCTDSGKELVKFPITQAIQPLETAGDETHGRKAVLCVHKEHLPNFGYGMGNLLGIKEDVRVIPVRSVAFGLPDDVIGYDGIDAIVWTDANPMDLSDQQVKAISDFVKRGGRLVFSQDTATNQWQLNNRKFGSLMPVTVHGVEEKNQVDALIKPAIPKDVTPKGPFRLAVAVPNSGARVVLLDEKESPFAAALAKNDDNSKSNNTSSEPPKTSGRPYIVRQALGAGCITWVAQDLGDRSIPLATGAAEKWAKIWDTIFDWPDEPFTAGPGTLDNDRMRWGPNISWELGGTTLKYLDLPSTSAALVGIAVLFFIFYWVAAGWGSYWVLARRGKSHLSWFTFGAIAIVATALTVLIVKLVLRGDAQLQHVTYARAVRGEPAQIRSNFGLYIPRDGLQKIELKDTVEGGSSQVCAFALHPRFVGDASDYLNHQDYVVPVHKLVETDRPSLTPNVIQVPYRSTLKKLQAQWAGNLPGGIEGTPVLRYGPGKSKLDGRIKNNTGHDLRMVFLVFNYPAIDTKEAIDRVLYVSHWKAGDELILGQELKVIGGAPFVDTDRTLSPLFNENNPSIVVRHQGEIQADRQVQFNYTRYWYYIANLRSSGYPDKTSREENDPLTPRAFPILSFYDRIYVAQSQSGTQNRPDRFDLLRRGVRWMDLSSAVSAGQLAIIAVADRNEAPLPYAMEVDGKQVKGKGIVYYQFVVPIDRSKLMSDIEEAGKPAETPAAKPTQPTTKPAT